MNTAKEIANYMLSKRVLTPKQVQKLLYYAYSLYLIKYNDKYQQGQMNKLFDDKIEAWEHGPVIREVYDYIKKVALSNQLVACNQKINLSSEKVENFIDKILKIYGNFSGYELEKMTHSEEPWNNAMKISKNSIISDEIIYNYYSNKYKNIGNM